ncbi:MAG TPA: type II toxin-antitoxin system ParD family antitoxin [Pseudaminobacter sp.]|jgi:antitoxin ParD1/3/4|nr:type II toxin-antitoxin system ParD family antitoxin [Pseudaminobacter sp.]
MSSVEKVSVALSPELLDVVKKAVATGEYGSASEVIREALREWRLRQPLRQAEIDRLRKAWAQGLESGQPEPFDIDDIMRRARNRFESGSDTPRNG